jgi:hypothetical protein
MPIPLATGGQISNNGNKTFGKLVWHPQISPDFSDFLPLTKTFEDPCLRHTGASRWAGEKAHPEGKQAGFGANHNGKNNPFHFGPLCG